MAEIRVENLHKSLRRLRRGAGLELHHPRRLVLLPARPVGLRQDDDAAHDRRARAADLRPDPPRRRGRHLPARLGARHRLRVPAVRALSAHECAAEHRLSAALPGRAARRRSASASRRRRGSCASIICSTSRSSGLAGGDRQRVALGRAIVRRPKAFLMDEPLGTLDAEFRDLMCEELRGAAQPHRRDHGLRHPRPARGDVDGRHDRRHEQRRGRAVRPAAARSTTGRPACSSPTSSARRR